MGNPDEPPAGGQKARNTHRTDSIQQLASEFRRSDEKELSLDELFDLLRNRRRRDILTYLAASDGTVTLDELAESIAADENDIEPNQLSSQQRKRVYISLYQNHLPKMDELGIVNYDQNRGIITLIDLSETKPYLPVDSDSESTAWPYLVFALCGLVIAGVVGIGPLSAVPSVAWTGVSVAALLCIALGRLLSLPSGGLFLD